MLLCSASFSFSVPQSPWSRFRCGFLLALLWVSLAMHIASQGPFEFFGKQKQQQSPYPGFTGEVLPQSASPVCRNVFSGHLHAGVFESMALLNFYVLSYVAPRMRHPRGVLSTWSSSLPPVSSAWHPTLGVSLRRNLSSLLSEREQGYRHNASLAQWCKEIYVRYKFKVQFL